MKKLVGLFITCLMMIGCEKDVVDYMETYYAESMGLQSVSIDSVKSFSNKVSTYVCEYPEEKQHPLYPKIQNNIKAAVIRITLEVDTTWDDTIHIVF